MGYFSSTESKNIDNKRVSEQTVTKPKIERHLTRKELFDELYIKYIDCAKRERKKKIISEMLPYFSKPEYCEDFVEINLQRKLRNLIARRLRMVRKANLANFNYFCTFTYDDALHTEESF